MTKEKIAELVLIRLGNGKLSNNFQILRQDIIYTIDMMGDFFVASVFNKYPNWDYYSEYEFEVVNDIVSIPRPINLTPLGGIEGVYGSDGKKYIRANSEDIVSGLSDTATFWVFNQTASGGSIKLIGKHCDSVIVRMVKSLESYEIDEEISLSNNVVAAIVEEITNYWRRDNIHDSKNEGV